MTNEAIHTYGIRSFESFHEVWMIRQQQHLDGLLSATDSAADHLGDLIGRVLSHYNDYYDEKSKLIGNHDALLLFSAPWLTRLERAFLWLGDFKPGLAVRLAATSAGDDLTEKQRREIETLMVRTRLEEKELNDEVARIHESLAAPPLFWARRRRLDPNESTEDEDEAVLESIKSALEEAVANADLLRRRTAVTVMEIFTPLQGVMFLAAAVSFQLQLHSNGFERETSETRN